MQLLSLNNSDLSLGKIVVLRTENENHEQLLRIVECIDAVNVHLAPLSLILDDDLVSEMIPLSEASSRLLIPIFEVGDRIHFQGHSGKIAALTENDYHIRVTLDDYPGKEVYTNLVHLDFQEQLIELMLRSNQIAP